MVKKSAIIRGKILSKTISSLRRDRRIERISIPLIAKELSMETSEALEYFSSIEDIFLKEQKSLWKKVYKVFDKKLKEAQHPADFKEILDSSYDLFVSSLPDDADLHIELVNYLPTCADFKSKNKLIYRKKLLQIIKKGWPGKAPNVLERQTDLVLMCFYGFLEHVAHSPKLERKRTVKDFRNMINLHLQDRLFF
tara:strand:+ start:5350 stop:5934 length:585 start_codon:yes stop_codon:yes gene_type:complete